LSDKDFIKDLFSEKLGNYEAKVNPELWNSIASQIGTAGAAGTAATGLSLAAKWIIGVGIAGALTVTTVLLVNNSEDPQNDAPATEETRTNPTTTESSALQENTTSATPDFIHTNVAANQLPQGQPVGPETNVPAPGENIIETGPATTEYVPTLIPLNLNDPILQEIAHSKKTVHTEDPVVKEPFMPAEIEAETPQKAQAVQKDYFIDKLPNIFTPNGDFVNEYFEINSENLTNFQVVVLDAQNRVVFQSRDPHFKWDGTDASGQPVPEGNYVYFITADEFGTEKPKRYSPLMIKH
jgi:gliding motility-associated-like protein